MLKRLFPLSACCLWFYAQPALADDRPQGLMQSNSASSGSTDVAKTGFESVDRAAQKATDATELKIVGGGVLAAGNSRSLAVTSSGNLRVRRDAHQLSILAAANYGRSAPDANSRMKTTIENYQGRARYDYFFTEKFAAFLAAGLRHDRFQGLDLRLNLSPGLAYYAIDEKTQQLWGELGYDLQRDIRTRDAVDAAAAQGKSIEKTETRHNARAFVGYTNSVNEHVSFNTGLEFLLALSPFKDDVTNRSNWRLAWDAGVTDKISDKFSLASTLSLRYDNNPLPGIQHTDALMSMNLVYTLL